MNPLLGGGWNKRLFSLDSSFKAKAGGAGAILPIHAIWARKSMTSAVGRRTQSSAADSSETSAYPLSAELTRRVVNYLDYFRLFIGLMLVFAFYSEMLLQVHLRHNPLLAATTLVAYAVLAAWLFYEGRRARRDVFYLAQTSLVVDIGYLSLLLYVFGGLDSGLGVLLLFFTACAAILLPLRLALFLASLGTLTVIGESALGGALRGGQADDLVRAALFGLTNFLTVVLAHALALWVRDFRLIAERQERTLTRLEQINELIIRRMRSGVLAVDHQGEIRMMNESAWFLLGSPSALDRVLSEVSPELHQALDDWQHRRDSGETSSITLHASQAEVMPKFVALPGDRDIRVLVFLEDNDVVAQRATELSANSLAKLSGSIAHEIRNPLAAVSHAAQLLDESEDLPEGERRLVDIIRKQSRRMNGIVENILQLSRREKSRPELFELTAWLEELMDEFRGSLSQDDLELVLDNGEPPVMVMFDRSQLHQALWKLMENAVQHAGGAGHAPRVVLRLERREQTGHCLVNVEDNGPGIPEDRIGHIFEPFYTTRQEGSGLGLYVARQLCEANQAVLTVDSSPKLGTRFHLRLATVRDAGDAQVAVATVEQEVS
jgi:two-component system sensor histidine kinase PilS (NtrC family)